MGVAHSHRSVLLQQQHSHGLAHHIATADNHYILAVQLDAIMLQGSHASPGRAGRPLAATHEHIATVLGIQAVHILIRRNSRAHSVAINMLGHGHHGQNAGHITVTVQLLHYPDNLFFAGCAGQLDYLGCAAQAFNQLH